MARVAKKAAKKVAKKALKKAPVKKASARKVAKNKSLFGGAIPRKKMLKIEELPLTNRTALSEVLEDAISKHTTTTMELRTSDGMLQIRGVNPHLVSFLPNPPETAQAEEAPTTRESDPCGFAQHEPGAKLDYGKIDPALVTTGFSRALEEVAKVATHGAEKYTRHGWRSVPNGRVRYAAAAGRHQLKAAREDIDAPSGCLHKAQVIWNLLAELELELTEKEIPNGSSGN